ncbi:MAG: hypothetical protein IPI82_17690 [Candidatus Microthrix sp.]|nr:hypothetical protein [Candidatus Microthrix sp.]MBK7324206.1 hypothetical protein [Candidatus Microthrix sp.]
MAQQRLAPVSRIDIAATREVLTARHLHMPLEFVDVHRADVIHELDAIRSPSYTAMQVDR